MEAKIKEQVFLLIRLLPEIAKDKDFALHGGTAINLFYFNVPRLSVDIDLTYLKYGSREHDLREIQDKLLMMKDRFQLIMPSMKIRESVELASEPKLFCTLGRSIVKVEVNTINRGTLSPAVQSPLSEKAGAMFRSYCEMQLVPNAQLFGGKLVAALDRQHPRDLFDVHTLMEHQGITDEIMEGFLFCLLSSNRPFHEVLKPALPDQKHTLDNQFSGMTDEVFTYDMFEDTRRKLINMINRKLSTHARDLIMSFASGAPVWDSSDYSMFPGIKWKLQNIHTLKEQNPAKHQFQLDQLYDILYK